MSLEERYTEALKLYIIIEQGFSTLPEDKKRKILALKHQANRGDAPTVCPDWLEDENVHVVWTGMHGMSTDDAKQGYADQIDDLMKEKDVEHKSK